jgi:hypothetical protein
MEKTFDIHLPVFTYTFHIIYTDDIDKSRKTRKSELGPSETLSEYVDGLHSYDKDEPESFIFFSPVSTVGVIAHEVFHALWQMFKYVGAKLENEIFAYHLTYILDKILDFKKAKSKKNK